MYLSMVLRNGCAMDRAGTFCTRIQGVRQATQAGSGSDPPTRRSGVFDSDTLFRRLLVVLILIPE